MEVFIIYAALSVGQLTTFVEFKGTDFKTLKECSSFFEEHRDTIKVSLREHINETYPDYIVSYVECSTRSKFIANSTDI